MVTHNRSRNKAQNQQVREDDKKVGKILDSLNIKIVRELVSDPDVSSTQIASKYDKPLSTIQRRRARLEGSLLTKSYDLDVRQLGWRTADLLVSVEKGKAEETARKLLDEQGINIISASLRIGHPQVDIMADVFYRDSIELHSLIQRVKSMPYVTYVEWAELVKVVGNNFDVVVDKLFDKKESR